MRLLHCNGSAEDICIVKQLCSVIESDTELNEKDLKFWDEIPLDPNIKRYNGSHILDRIHHKIEIEEPIYLNKSRSKISFTNYQIRIAAILFISVLFASIVLHYQNNYFRIIKSYAEIHSTFATRTTFSVPDGTFEKRKI